MGYAVLRGDYSGRGGYGAQRGDPFLGGVFKAVTGLVKKAAPLALSVLPGGSVVRAGVAGAVKLGGKILGAGRAVAGSRAGRVAAGIGSIAAGTYVGEKLAKGFGGGGEGRRYKRINPANVKALRRAIRRMEGFQKLAKSTGCLPKPARRSASSRRCSCK